MSKRQIIRLGFVGARTGELAVLCIRGRMPHAWDMLSTHRCDGGQGGRLPLDGAERAL